MPCLILTGHPCCGKSTLAKAIEQRALLRSDIANVLILTDHASDNEKATRAELKSHFDRRASSAASNTLIIVDAMNAIKGYRYELYCISKASGQAHGVLWVMNSVANCYKYNGDCRHFSEDQLKDLIQRYEPPDDRNRWDQPLFRVDVRPDGERTESLEAELLKRSIYDMHNLKDALTTDTSNASTSEATTNSKDVALSKPKKKGASFKRAAKPLTSTSPAEPRVYPEPKLDLSFLKSLEQDSALDQPLMESVDEATVDKWPARQFTPAPPTQQRYEEDLSLSLEQRIDLILDLFLKNTKRLEQGTSTQQNVSSDANVLHVIDATTQQVVSAIVAAQAARSNSGTEEHDEFVIQVANMPPQPIKPATANITAAELRQRRQQYLKWTTLYPPNETTPQAIVADFLEYIEQHKIDK